MILSKDQFFEAFAVKTENVRIADDKELRVRQIPSHVAAKFRQHENQEAFIFVNVVVDGEGKRYWSDDDIPTVVEKVDPSVVALVISRAWVLTDIEPERAEEIKKNWRTLRGETSGESPSA